MAAIPGMKSATPFLPTVDETGQPGTCICCGLRAVGIGVNRTGKGDPQYLCKRCIVGIDDYTKIRRLDDFELAALDAGVEAVGEYIATHGVTELTHFDSLMQRMMVKAAWEGCGNGLRAALREAPF